MKVEFLLAYEDHTWDTLVVDVVPAKGKRVPRSIGGMIQWAQEHLAGQAQYRRVVLFGVYGMPAQTE